jgi:hypothetical protein
VCPLLCLDKHPKPLAIRVDYEPEEMGKVHRGSWWRLALWVLTLTPVVLSPCEAAAQPEPVRHGQSESAQSEDVAAVRLQHTLDYYAQQERQSRLAVGWSSTVAGAVGVGAGAYINSRFRDGSGWVISGASIPLVVLGLSELLGWSDLEGLAASGRQGGGLLVTEQEWSRLARHEKMMRHLSGGMGLVISGIAFGAAALALFDSALFNDLARRETYATLFSGFGILSGVFSVHTLASDGPVERGLRAYEQSSGRVSGTGDVARGQVQFGFVPGGAIGGFAIRF